MSTIYNKLVRDRIPEIIEQDGKTAVTKTLSGDALQAALFTKLGEEHAELVAAKNLEEIADVIEVLLAIAQLWGYDEQQTLLQVHKKRLERGSFEQGIFLERVENHDKSV